MSRIGRVEADRAASTKRAVWCEGGHPLENAESVVVVKRKRQWERDKYYCEVCYLAIHGEREP